MKTKRTLAKQSLFYAVANGVEAMVPFLLAPLLTRMLAPAEYGIWVLFVTYATFLRPFIGLTVQDAIRMRFYDFDEGQLDRFVRTAFFIMTAVMVTGAGLAYVFRDFLAVMTQFPAVWMVSIVVAAFLFEAFYTALALHQFHGRRMMFLYTQIIQAALSLVFILAFLLAGWGWQGVILGRMASLALSVVISLGMLGYRPTGFLRLPERSFYRNIAGFGVLYVPSGMVIMAMAMIDKVAAAHFLGVAASALYGVAALFASAYWVVNNSFLLAWTPWLFRRLKTDEPGRLTEVLSVSGLYFVTATLAAGAIYALSIWVAPVLLGEAFHEAIPLTKYIMLAILLQGFFMHNMKFLHQEKAIVVMSVCSLLAIVMNLWLTILWAPEGGVRGIMLATAVSFGATFILSGILVLAHLAGSNNTGAKQVV
ncbi:oligosaccharide flippase family protein [Alphaproteobacteria bacterium GH1-50]|uniref:Oligosaccharide flippase family protein n=1 Tax=Kangsaoukella pontilimi TaxID=2691042 RepID=A0A7C9IIL2_9RHOB|nr:oligosaccharide flippase family protein [Kangsaoukella pontilimi]MXQ09367.1 oligosaccharide flippase family protein [Kangsaoukella pontilimi]